MAATKKNSSSTFYVFNYNQVKPKNFKVTELSWVPSEPPCNEKPFNVHSGTIYDKENFNKLTNSFIWKTGHEHRFYWSTLNGWSNLGYIIKKGEHGIQLYKNKPDFHWYDDSTFNVNAVNIKG